jgi:AcrR family transcriptional regulator
MKTSSSPTRKSTRSRARRRDPEAKRAQLMASARELFAKRGYGATTTADVARHAGVSEGIVFHHFGSKAELLASVAADYGRGLAQAMESAARAVTPERAIEASLRAAFAFVREEGELARFLNAASEPDDAAAVRAASREPIVASIERQLRAQESSGHLRGLDARITAELLYALVGSALTECYFHGDGSRESEYLRETVACVEGAVLARVPNSHTKNSHTKE